MKRSNCGVINHVVGFLESVLLQCFFGCFGNRDDRQRASRSLTNHGDSLLVKTKVDSALCWEGETLISDGSSSGQLSNGVKHKSFCNHTSLEYEGKYLETCCTSSETPTQAWKSPEKLDFQMCDEDVISSVFHSCPSGGCAKLQNSNEKLDSVNPAEVNRSSDLPENGYTCCNLDKECIQGTKPQFKRIEHVPEDELQGNSMHMEHSPLNTKRKIQIQTFEFNDSPHCTPLHLTDEMQTPATVYPVSLENTKVGKHARIRTQYVYPILKPVENLVEWRDCIEGTPHLVQSDNRSEKKLKHKRRDRKAKQQSSCTPGLMSSNLWDKSFLSPSDKGIQEEEVISIRNLSSGNLTDGAEKLNLNLGAPETVETSLSQWLKPRPLTDDAEGIHSIPKEQSQPHKTSDEDRPIIGFVAAHWNDIQSSHVTPKWWDGNGIPNSTKKYKEDQKVSWHATPFEERLEKVLSDEKLLPHRKLHDRRPIEFEEEGNEF